MPARFTWFRHHRLTLLSGQRWRMRLVLWGGAIAVGVIGVAFAWAANRATELFQAMLISPWLALVITPLGFVLCAWLTRSVFPGAEGSGIPQAIAARKLKDDGLRGSLLSLRLTAGKILLTLIGLMTGASIGREGPTVQVGASIMLVAAKWGGMGREKGLILAGAAAGVAAAFNTPLAGIVFAIEEMSRAFESRTSGLVLMAVILAGLASLAMVGDYSYFGHSTSTLSGALDWLAVPLCGVAGGVLGAAFSALVVNVSRWLKVFVAHQPMRRSLAWAFACGMVVALCGLLSHGMTYGTGYDAAKSAIEGHTMAASFTPLKFIANTASTLSGIPGGLFSPSLSVGAGLGSLIAALLGAHATGAIVLLGMSAYFAGVVQAPITAFVIIEEMSDASAMVIPLMIAAVIGYGVSRLFQRESIYHALARDFLATLPDASGR
ncbi:MAG TPA: chloride channel protein [Rhizomicrobium sp.]|jgi:H+/Cl- antiporter ClcA|nr:chloride channel protein [Rhizomicrobium sp.]